MEQAIGDVLPLGIGVAICPAPITAVIPMLGAATCDGIGSPSS